MNEEEFTTELTIGDVYDNLCEQVADARTRALMGERAEALRLYQTASLEYERFRDALHGLPLHTLEHDFTVTRQILCVDRCLSELTPVGPMELVPVRAAEPVRPRVRKRAAKAA